MHTFIFIYVNITYMYTTDTKIQGLVCSEPTGQFKILYKQLMEKYFRMKKTTLEMVQEFTFIAEAL